MPRRVSDDGLPPWGRAEGCHPHAHVEVPTGEVPAAVSGATCRRIAAAVLAQAVHDAPHLCYEDARRMLSGQGAEGEGLAAWCAMAGLDPQAVIKLAERRGWHRPLTASQPALQEETC